MLADAEVALHRGSAALGSLSTCSPGNGSLDAPCWPGSPASLHAPAPLRGQFPMFPSLVSRSQVSVTHPHQSHCFLTLAGRFWVLYRMLWPGSINKITRQS